MLGDSCIRNFLLPGQPRWHDHHLEDASQFARRPIIRATSNIMMFGTPDMQGRRKELRQHMKFQIITNIITLGSNSGEDQLHPQLHPVDILCKWSWKIQAPLHQKGRLLQINRGLW